jgi:alginate O-acetyltransferase complex protein AlgI
MLFNSYTFILIFAPITVLAYFALCKRHFTVAATGWLVAASVFFYAFWDARYAPLLLGSVLFNFSVGSILCQNAPERRKNTLLACGVIGNLGLLGYFKYTDFFLANLSLLVNLPIPLAHITLPLGISFFTFTQIAYLVDAKNGRAREYDILNYTLFVTFFPHLLAGPILHHGDMMPQFNRLKNKVLSAKNVSLGLHLFCIGLFKKVIVADTFGAWANSGFDPDYTLTLVEAWATSLFYSLQIYFDFSGYTDMALGMALMLNIRLPVNFNSPYQATSIQDFWRRWHMTLSRFLRDYVYIPLGGNRGGLGRTLANVFATFLIGGVWHGADWTFVAWGALHGAAMLGHRLWLRLHLRMPSPLGWLLTFLFVNAAWVFFRAKDFSQAVNVLRGMAGLNGVRLPAFLQGFAPARALDLPFGTFLDLLGEGFVPYLWLAAAMAAVLFLENSNQMTERFKPDWKRAAFTAATGFYALLHVIKTSEFLYFQF